MKKLLLSIATLGVTMGFAQKFDIVKNINPTSNGDSDPYSLTHLKDDIIVFGAYDTAVGYEVFISDGTVSGTKMVKDINPGNNGSDPDYFFKAADNRIYFQAYVDSLGYELFVTDGTTAGTSLIRDINPGSNGSNPYSFIDYKGKVFFRAYVDSMGLGIFSTDGTSAGTQLITVINDGNNTNIYLQKVHNNLLFFSAYVDSVGFELFVTDGTAAGTRLVKDIYPGTDNSYPSDFAVLNNQLYFTANTYNEGREIWVTDGTEAGTKLFYDINPYGSSGASKFTVFNNKLYFAAYHDYFGNEVWVIDGVAENTKMLKEINPYGDAYPDYFTEYNGKLYFTASNDSSYTLYATDGTTLGTEIVLERDGNEVGNLVVFKNRLYFVNYDQNWNYKIYFTNGTYGDQHEVINEISNFEGYGYDFWDEDYVVTPNILYTAGYYSTFGNELYKITYMDIVSLEEQSATVSTLNVYPNPATEIISVSFEGVEGAQNALIIDMTGRVVFEKEVQIMEGNNTIDFNVTTLNEGAYFVKVGNLPAQKFIKK